MFACEDGDIVEGSGLFRVDNDAFTKSLEVNGGAMCNILHRAIERIIITYPDEFMQTCQGGHLYLSSTVQVRLIQEFFAYIQSKRY